MAPLKTPTTLVTSIPNKGDEGQTIDIGGEKVPVMTQADLDKVLDHKVPVSVFIKSSQTVDLWLAVGKDGKVEKVEGVNGEASVSKDGKGAVRQWRFKPFVLNGEEVAVQTVIQLKGEKTKEQP